MRCCQDELGNRDKTMRVAEGKLRDAANRGVLIDRTGFNRAQRAHFVELAKKNNAAVIAVTVTPDEPGCGHDLASSAVVEACIARCVRRQKVGSHPSDKKVKPTRWPFVVNKLAEAAEPLDPAAEGFDGVARLASPAECDRFIAAWAATDIRPALEAAAAAISPTPPPRTMAPSAAPRSGSAGGVTRLVFVRHGESVANKRASHHDSRMLDSHLTELGREQARSWAGRAAQGLAVEAVVCSPLRQAMETAALVFGEGHCHRTNVAAAVPIEVCRYAREKNWKDWQNRGCGPNELAAFAADLSPVVFEGLAGLEDTDEHWDPEAEGSAASANIQRFDASAKQ